MKAFILPAAYVAGVMASVSPCVIVLIPLVLCRFVSNSSRMVTVLFGAGFITSYVAFAVAISMVSTAVHIGFRLGCGGLCISIGMLSLTDQIDAVTLPVVSNPFLVGTAYALMVSLNPCTLPFLGVVMSLQIGDEVAALVAFAVGLVTPAMLFLTVGHSVVSAATHGGLLAKRIGRCMCVVLIITGCVLTSCSVYESPPWEDRIIAWGLTGAVAVMTWHRSVTHLHARRHRLVFQRVQGLIGLAAFLCVLGEIGHDGVAHEAGDAASDGMCANPYVVRRLCPLCAVFHCLRWASTATTVIAIGKASREMDALM